MYLIKSNNIFYLNMICNLMDQINIPVSLIKSNSQYGEIHFLFKDNHLTLKFNSSVEKINLPISFYSLTQNLFLIMQNFKIKFDNLDYNPIQESLTLKNKTLKLRNTHNLIIREAIKYKAQGLNKIDLYKIIWPKDLDPQINKLDTHLTNLKNLLLEEFSYKLKFSSYQGKLVFLIN
jgi:hypothetical protein